MEAIVLQSISFIVLVLLFIYVFKKYPLNTNVNQLVLAAVFVLLNVALNGLSLMVPFFGFPSVKISFALLPLMVSGFVLTPSWAYLVGLCADLIGLIVTPTSFPFLGFTLNHVLISTLPAIWYQRSESIKPASIQKLIRILLSVFTLAATIYIFTLSKVPLGEETFEMTIELKLALSAFVVGMAVVLHIVLKFVQSKMSDKETLRLAQWMFAVVGIEILVNMILTPFWLQSMYQIPWYLSTMIRIVKACIMIPLTIVLGYHVIKIIKRVSSK